MKDDKVAELPLSRQFSKLKLKGLGNIDQSDTVLRVNMREQSFYCECGSLGVNKISMKCVSCGSKISNELDNKSSLKIIKGGHDGDK